MPQYCCVPLCTNASAGHTFPKNNLLKKKWCVAIRRVNPVTKRLWEPKLRDRVCGNHFTPEDYFERSEYLGVRKRLKPGAVPSVFKFGGPVLSSSASERTARHARKETLSFTNEIPEISNEIEVVSERLVTETISDVTLSESELLPQCCDVAVECSLLTDINSRMSIHNFKDNSRAIQYYTGMDDYNHFLLIFNVLAPAVYHLNFKCTLLEPLDQLFLVLMKFRQAKEDRELSILFNISESTVSFLVIKWINFLYFQLKEISLWPTKSVVQQHMPHSFGKQFSSTRVVLDATEVPISKPSNANAQSAIFSTYKNKNTLKTMIGCTPRGAVSYISDSYGGSASDRQIIERSSLLCKGMFEPEDSIMADRGILVQDLFATQDVYVNTPTMLKGKSQLDPKDVVRDRRIASKRIHVERVIGLGKTFKLLRKELTASKRILGSRIIYICYVLSNFRKAIVNRLA